MQENFMEIISMNVNKIELMKKIWLLFLITNTDHDPNESNMSVQLCQ